MAFRYSGSGTIYPNDIRSAVLSYNDGIDFEIGENGYPVPIAAPDIIEPAMTAPYPAQLWRIDPDWNGGYPFNLLQPDIEYTPPPPEPTNPERANWLGHWFIRLNDIDRDKTSVMGYISRKADRAFKPINFKNISNWNKSLQDLNNSYYQMLGDDILGGLIPWEYND